MGRSSIFFDSQHLKMATESLSEAIYKTINGSGNTTIFPEMSGFTGSSETCSNLTEKAPRPPNRKKNDEELADLTVKIKELEDAKQKSSEQLRLAREQVNCFRDRRDQISGQKYDVDEKLNVINKSVEVKINEMIKSEHYKMIYTRIISKQQRKGELWLR